MRVFAPGGYGTYGRLATELLADSDLISEIALAGRPVDRAGQIAAEIGGKATVVQVDGTDDANPRRACSFLSILPML